MENPIILFLLGLAFLFIGIVNLGGDISTIKWLNRRNVAPEDELPFGRLMGAGTILCGIGMMVLALFSTFLFSLYLFAVCAAVGIGLMAYACFKYNHGFF